MNTNLSQHQYYMNLAIQEALTAKSLGEVPIGAVIVSSAGELIGRGYNLKESEHDATLHAELVAIKNASTHLKAWRLTECTIYVTLEPCPMCLSALLQSRIKKLVFGAYDKKGGSMSLGYNFASDARLNHSFETMGGVMHMECSKILSDFFKEKRKSYQKVVQQ